jgi:hypothetical protein
MSLKSRILLCLLVSLIPLGQSRAQDIEPRRWTPLPPGLNFVGAGIADTTGNISFDPALRIENARLHAKTAGVSYIRSFSMTGRMARFDISVPWQNAYWSGLLDGQPASATRVGLADPILRLSVILAGATPDPTAASNTVFGVAMSVTLPMGEYFADKLLNLGQNRYVFRPQAGFVHTRGQWSFELTGSAFIYTDNDEFYGGITLAQDPLLAVQGHAIYSFKKPGYWASLSTAYGWGGESVIAGSRSDDDRRQFLSALSAGVPLGSRQSVKLAYIRNSTNANTGASTNTVALGWSLRF